MKLLFFFMMLFSSAKAFSSDFIFEKSSDLLPEQNARLKKIADFLEKKKYCNLVAIQVPTNPTSEHIFSLQGGYNKVSCLGNMTVDEGTINKKSGCALTKYDVAKNEFGNVLMITDKDCLKGGFENIQKLKASCTNGIGRDSLKDCLFNTPASHWRAVLLFSKDKGLSDWFRQNNSSFKKEAPKPEKKQLSMLEQADLDDAQRDVCVGWLVEQKFPPDSWQYKSSGLKRYLKSYKEKYGKGDIKDVVETVCKPVVKEQICNSHADGKVHNEGVIPGYFIYGYPDLNVLFKKYKNSMEVATQLCGKKTDFHYPSVNQMEGYETSTK